MELGWPHLMEKMQLENTSPELVKMNVEIMKVLYRRRKCQPSTN
jgi:hypothetical protein